MMTADSKDERRPSDNNANNCRSVERSIAVIDNRIESTDLFVATREIIIGHGGECYRLRLTSQNKLILTK
jgi:hemin uptake protein HemP